MYQLLLGIRSSGLENDALLEIFYEMTGEKYRSDHEYGIFVFHDRYDIPAKAADHVRLGESEQMFEYLICAVCPVTGAYRISLRGSRANSAAPQRGNRRSRIGCTPSDLTAV